MTTMGTMKAVGIVVRPIRGNGLIPYWSHEELMAVAGSKLRRLIMVKGEKDGRKVRFRQADAYETFHLADFVNEILRGEIVIDFDAREAKPGSPSRNSRHGCQSSSAWSNPARRFSSPSTTRRSCQGTAVRVRPAELRPARHQRPRDNLEDILEDLAASGDITRSALPKKNWTWKARGLGLSTGTAKDILDEIRGDR